MEQLQLLLDKIYNSVYVHCQYTHVHTLPNTYCYNY